MKKRHNLIVRSRRIYLAIAVSLVGATLAMLPMQPALATPDKQVGIWFSTWYTNKGKYNWTDGFGAGSKKQFLADVNGDGKDDAVSYFDSGSMQGDWYVALSDGTQFGNPVPWLTGNGAGSQNQMLADVTGDGKADAVFYFDVPGGFAGKWYVAPSNGSNFTGASPWIDGHGHGSKSQMLGDIDGDGKADALAFFDSPGFAGKWYAAISSGSGFYGAYQWADGHGAGSKKQFLGDVNGDNKADAVAFFDSPNFAGKWYVATSNGAAGINNASMWADGHGHGSTQQLLADATGDGKADAIVYFHSQSATIPPAAWYKADGNATGNGFTGNQLWKYSHGNYVLTDPSSERLLGDVDGNGSSDPVVFVGQHGTWRMLPAEQYTEPPEMNLWEAWNVKYRPLVNGVPSIYDSGDPAVIDEQLDMIDNAGIDYILLELTNGVHQTYIYPRAKKVCERLAAHNAAGGSLKFAVAAGDVQNTQNPQTVEDEAAQVQADFVNDPICGSSYYSYQGKPLYVAYGNYNDLFGPNGWQSYGNKTTTNSFTVIPALSTMPAGAEAYNYPSKTGGGCGTVPSGLLNTPHPSQYGTMIAWGLPYGTLGSGPIMPVMPGWINKTNQRILRTQNGVEGGFYTACGWDRVLASQPDMTVINSFNEFAERTGVQPADTSPIGDPLEQWSSPNFYWNLTVQKVQQLKS